MIKNRKRFVIWMNFHGKLKFLLIIVLLMMVVFIFSYELPATETWSRWSMPLSGKIIALDAGHGGPDGGAVSQQGIIEKDINLAITLYLRDYLQESGAIVVMTREIDKDLADTGTHGLSRRKTQDLIRRAKFVMDKKADMMVSVHLNSITSSRWYGAQTFYYAKNKDSKGLATFIQKEIIRNLENTDRVAKTTSNVYLLKELPIPSALVEVGFLSNPREANLLATSKYQKKIAASIYQGIIRFYSGEKLGTN